MVKNCFVLSILQHPFSSNMVVVNMLIGSSVKCFLFQKTLDRLDGRNIEVIQHCKDFGVFFKYNQHISLEVTDLVKDFFKEVKTVFPFKTSDFVVITD